MTSPDKPSPSRPPAADAVSPPSGAAAAPSPIPSAASAATPVRESMSLKRGREGSVDPLVTPSSAPIATKKNRLDEQAGAKDIDVTEVNEPNEPNAGETDEESNTSATSRNAQTDAPPEREGKTVGEVRRKVEEMNWKEGQGSQQPNGEAGAPAVDEDNADGADKEAATDKDDADWVQVDKADAAATPADTNATAAAADADATGTPAEDADSTSDSPSLKRKAKDDGDESSEEKKRKSTSPIPPEQSSPAAAPKKTQPTFGAFSSAASPFATLNASSSASPLGSASPNKQPVFGSSSSKTSPFASASPSASEPAAATAPPKKQPTFGSFSSTASPFATKASSASPFGSASSTSPFGATATDAKAKSALDEAPAKPKAASAFGSSGFGGYSSAFSAFSKKPADQVQSSTSFGDILKEKGEDKGNDTKVHLDKQDVMTGEEDEMTVYATRCKLFIMEESGGWKERGMGQIKINRRRDRSGPPRLVMRTDGALRVVLNASLYVGMPCLEDGKHVRTTIFDGKDRRFITLRANSPKLATELCAAIQEHIPLESHKSPTPSAPLAPDSAA